MREVVGADVHAAAFFQHGVVKGNSRLAENVDVVKGDVVRVADLHGIDLGIGCARDAIHIGVGKQEIFAVLNVERVSALVPRFLFGLQAVDFPVLHITEHHLDAAMMLV